MADESAQALGDPLASTSPTADAIAIIFAGGSGSRMESAHDRPKQFVEVGDAPILIHTVRHFQSHPRVSRIYIATLDSYLETVEQMLAAFAITKVRKVVAGGSSAHASIFNALRAAVADGAPDDAVALIHDGVRPIINEELIDRNIESTLVHGNAISSIPAFETIAEVSAGSPVVDEVGDRARMHVLQAPQTFRLDEIYAMNLAAEKDNLIGRFVDQADLMHHYKNELHLVHGMRGNVKLTVPLDVMFFRFLFDSGQYHIILRGGAW